MQLTSRWKATSSSWKKNRIKHYSIIFLKIFRRVRTSAYLQTDGTPKNTHSMHCPALCSWILMYHLNTLPICTCRTNVCKTQATWPFRPVQKWTGRSTHVIHQKSALHFAIQMFCQPAQVMNAFHSPGNFCKATTTQCMWPPMCLLQKIPCSIQWM